MIYLPKKPKFFGQQLRVGHWSTNGLVFLWRGIPAGNVVDESLYRNHGTITGATWQGQGLSFDGADDYILIDPIRWPNGDGDLTIVMLVTPESFGEFDQGFLWTSTGGTFLFTTSGGLRLNRTYSDTNGAWRNTSDFNLVGNRSHLVLTQSGDDAPLIYINGIFRATLPILTTPVGSKVTLDGVAISLMSNTATSRALDGLLEQTMFYNRALSASEIQALYLNPNLPMQQPPTSIFYGAPIVEDILYSRGDVSSLPANDNDLETTFTSQDYTDVASDDGVRVSQTAQGEYSIFLFKNKNTQQDTITLNWNGQSDIAPSSSTVYLQIFNKNSSEWETLDSNNTENVDIDFDLNGVQSTNLDDYFDENFWISWRVYQ